MRRRAKLINIVKTLAACCCATLVLACDGGDDSDSDDEAEDGATLECVDYVVDGCAALFPATYEQVWSQTLDSGCAGVGLACHAQDDAAGAMGGMVFADPQETWQHLIDTELVIAGDPQCSPLFIRLATDDPELRMPPGSSSIDDGALCSIATWIEQGATQE